MPDTRTSAVAAARETVPFLVIMVIWSAIMLALYGVFILTKPDVTYPTWAYASVFLPGLIGFAGHTLSQALASRGE